jgi:hypothetical protein
MEAVVIVALVLIVVAVAAYLFVAYQQKNRTQSLRTKFGPEYDRTVEERGDRKRGEKDLMARSDRRSKLEIRPLDSEARERYAASWRDTQATFVDDPKRAIREADALIILVMRDRGYPVDDFEQRTADVSVDHPKVVENYRAAHTVSEANERGEATTEELRHAMVHYRELFKELLDVEDITHGLDEDREHAHDDRPREIDLTEERTRRTG